MTHSNQTGKLWTAAVPVSNVHIQESMNHSEDILEDIYYKSCKLSSAKLVCETFIVGVNTIDEIATSK